MSRARVGWFFAVAVCAVVWSAQALVGHAARLENQPIIMMIRSGEAVPEKRALATSIADYESALKWAACNTALHADLSLLLAQNADAAMALPDAKQGDSALEAMKKMLVSRLACTPRDGKAWLDVAMVDVFREGATPRALSAYRMSALAAPGESWLAKKRLEFALMFLPVLTANEIAIARADLAVLEHAHPNNMIAIQAAAQVENKPALYAIFGATVPVDAP